MTVPFSVRRAADILLAGGVIAYPTEGVFGLGCLPDDPDAVVRLLSIKKRDPAKGLILIASSPRQLRGWIAADAPPLPEPDTSHPITWIVPAGPACPWYISGDHPGVAVRLTTNQTAAALCDAVDSPLVSTSANRSNRPTARNAWILRRSFHACVDYIVPGDCGPATGPSEIRILGSDKILRRRAT